LSDPSLTNSSNNRALAHFGALLLTQTNITKLYFDTAKLKEKWHYENFNSQILRNQSEKYLSDEWLSYLECDNFYKPLLVTKIKDDHPLIEK
jgi:hypothetical protein